MGEWNLNRGKTINRAKSRKPLKNPDYGVESAKAWREAELLTAAAIWPIALELAFASAHSPYDTLSVAAAGLRRTKVLTYDEKLPSLFPDDTI